MHTRMEEPRVAAVDHSQHLLGGADFDQLESCCYGWSFGFELGEGQRQGFLDWNHMVDGDCGACDVHELYGTPIFTRVDIS